MSAKALDLFPNDRGAIRTPRAPRHEVPIATPDDLKRARLVQALFTCAAPRELAPIGFLATPAGVLERILADLGRTPHQISVQAFQATPNDVEIRDETDKDSLRFLLALVFTGLNIAEARAALATLQATTRKPKGTWS